MTSSLTALAHITIPAAWGLVGPLLLLLLFAPYWLDLALGVVLRIFQRVRRNDLVSSASLSGVVEELTPFRAYVKEADGTRFGIPYGELLDGYSIEHSAS